MQKKDLFGTFHRQTGWFTLWLIGDRWADSKYFTFIWYSIHRTNHPLVAMPLSEIWVLLYCILNHQCSHQLICLRTITSCKTVSCNQFVVPEYTFEILVRYLRYVKLFVPILEYTEEGNVSHKKQFWKHSHSLISCQNVEKTLTKSNTLGQCQKMWLILSWLLKFLIIAFVVKFKWASGCVRST